MLVEGGKLLEANWDLGYAFEVQKSTETKYIIIKVPLGQGEQQF